MFCGNLWYLGKPICEVKFDGQLFTKCAAIKIGAGLDENMCSSKLICTLVLYGHKAFPVENKYAFKK